MQLGVVVPLCIGIVCLTHGGCFGPHHPDVAEFAIDEGAKCFVEFAAT